MSKLLDILPKYIKRIKNMRQKSHCNMCVAVNFDPLYGHCQK